MSYRVYFGTLAAAFNLARILRREEHQRFSP